MGRREDRSDSSGTMNTNNRSELECLQENAFTGNDASDQSPRLDNHRPVRADRQCENRDRNLVVSTPTHKDPLEVKKHQHKHNLKHRYEVMETLGKGTYGKVKKAVERSSQNTVAIKSIRKEHITDDLDRVHIQREIEITSSLKHPNIVRFHEVFESRDKIVIVMEYASRGELYDYVQARSRLPEAEARDIYRQITSAVHYCHKTGVVHRDLKLENILLDKDMNVKLADFGLANHFQKSCLLQTYCGSPLYASPEIVKGLPYQGPEVDCWALGVLLYTLVYGSMPFDGASHAALTEQICQGRYRRPNPPSDACALIDWLLTVRADERATVEDVANHWWVNWGYEESVCDCPSAPHQDCPSPLLARYIDWQNCAAANIDTTADLVCRSPDRPRPAPPAPHAFWFSSPLKGERGGGGGGGGGWRVRGGTSSLRKSRKENAIPQSAPGARSSVCTAVPAPGNVASASTLERKKTKSILKPQRSFDSLKLCQENAACQPCSASPQPYQQHTLAYTQTERQPISMTPPSTFSQPSFKMPKKGILKNMHEGESESASPVRRAFGVATGEVGTDGSVSPDVCSCKPHPCPPSVGDSPNMHTEAVRRRKGILKRNGKFSRSLDLDHSEHMIVPGMLQQLLQATGGAVRSHSRPSSVVSEDSILSSDSFDLLDLSAQPCREIFSQGVAQGTCSSEEDLRETGAEAGGGLTGVRESERM